MRKVVAVAAIRDGLLLLVRKKETWILPGGKPEEGETNQACLVREVSEELLDCTVTNLHPLGVWEAKTPHTGDIAQCWVYSGEVEGPIQPSAEISEARWISAAETETLPLSDATRQLVATLQFTGRL